MLDAESIKEGKDRMTIIFKKSLLESPSLHLICSIFTHFWTQVDLPRLIILRASYNGVFNL